MKKRLSLPLLLICGNAVAGAISVESGYTQVYGLDLNGAGDLQINVPYYLDNSASVPTGSYDRIAYHVQLREPGGQVQWVWVSMDAFTADASLIGVPSAAGSNTSFQQLLSNMNVFSNVAGVATGRWSTGNIEFWPQNYGQTNDAAVPGATDSTFDFGDLNANVGTYGSMQVHNYGAAQTLFALNDFVGGGAGYDLGLGNSTGADSDWTFADNSGNYDFKTIDIWVRNNMDTAPLLDYAGKLGGDVDDFAQDIEVMPNGDVIIAGETNSANYVGDLLPGSVRNGYDVFVTRFSPATGAIVWSRIFGSSGEDQFPRIAVAANGEIALTVRTPDDSQALRIVRFDGATGTVVFDQPFGGTPGTGVNFPTTVRGMTVDSMDRIVIMGDNGLLGLQAVGTAPWGAPPGVTTCRTEWPPGTTFFTVDAYVARFDTSGNPEFVYCILSPTAARTAGRGLAVDSQDNIILTGYTFGTDFPDGIAGPNPIVGDRDIWNMKLSADGTSQLWTTFFGSAGADFTQDVVVDTSDDIFLAGFSGSVGRVIKIGGSDGEVDAFRTIASSDGSAEFWDVSLDGNGNVYAAGSSTSKAFPLRNPVGTKKGANGSDNLVAVRLDSDLELIYSTFLDTGTAASQPAAAVNAAGQYHVARFATAAAPDVGTAPANQTLGGLTDAYVVRLTPGVSNDSDGIPDSIEAMAPNGGDGNSDGVPDADQNNVASTRAIDGNFVTIIAGDNSILRDVSIENAPPGNALKNVSRGAIGFEMSDLPSSGETTVTILFHGGVQPTEYWKFGAQIPGGPLDWYQFPAGTTAPGVEFGAAGGGTYTATLHLKDGVLGDGDLTVNGIIDDPGIAVSPLADVDGDSVQDYEDNCVLIVNGDQYDANLDGIGSLCDGDIDGPGGVEDCLVNFLDLNAMKVAFFTDPSSPTWNPLADFNNDLVINFPDLNIVKAQFFGPPGPSAIGCDTGGAP